MTRPTELGTKLLLAAGVASGGGAFVVGHLAVATTPPATLATYRYVLALALFAALLRATGSPWTRPSRGDALRIAGMGLAVVAGYNLLFFQGLKLAPASDGGLIVPGSTPTWSILLSSLILRERPSRRAVAGSAIAAAGIVLIFAAAGGFGDASPARREGDILYLAGGSMWALFFVLSRGLQGRIGPLLANTYAAAIGLIIIVALALTTERSAILSVPPLPTWLEAAYLGVFATVLLLYANVRGVARLGVAGAAPFAYIAPVAAVVGSIVFLAEPVGALVLLGGAVALAGTWIATSHGRLIPWRATAQPEAA
ncbi:MAG TPA: DMT family transporter [Candidatus Dormibacteraeota bacterium]